MEEDEEEAAASDGHPPPPRARFRAAPRTPKASLIMVLLFGLLARFVFAVQADGNLGAADNDSSSSSSSNDNNDDGGGERLPIWSVIEASEDNQTGQVSTWQMLVAALFEGSDGKQSWPNLALALFIIVLMLTTAIGNLFVIVAILIERNLRTIGNYLVLSLAIADLLVALLVMPLASVYLILDQWTLGVLLCDIWTSADVCCCTASILHLLAIALDRYWAVTRVDYIRCQRNERRILLMIFFVWAAACVISMGPAFGWKDAEYEKRILVEKECLISQDVGYQVFATCATFYFPVTLTLVFYWKIYQVARKRIRRKLHSRAKLQPAAPVPSSSSSAGSTAAPAQRQAAKNQSIVKYEPKSGIVAKFKHCQGTISATTCECACHLNQAQSSGHCRLSRGANSQPEAGGKLVKLAQVVEGGANNTPGGAGLNVMRSLSDRQSKSEINSERQTLADRYSSQINDELDFDHQQAPISNNSETNLRRRQSNLNSSSSCSRCNARRNRFQSESQSNSLCSSSLQHEEDEEDEEERDNQNLAGCLARTKADFSSLSSTNCNQHELNSMETNSLDDARKLATQRDQLALQLGGQLHRKSLGGGGQCDCCACAVCCRGSAEATVEATERPEAGGEVVFVVAAKPEVERTIEVVLDGCKGTKSLVSSFADNSTRLIDDAGGSLRRAHDSSSTRVSQPPATWWRCLVRRLTPAESTRNMIAICWRRLKLIRTKQSSRHNYCQPPDAQSTGPAAHQANYLDGSFGAEQQETAASSKLAFCPLCQCPAGCSRQQAPVVQFEAGSVAAAVASSTTQVALTAAESLVQRSKTFTNSSCNQKAKVQLIEQQQSLPTVQSQAAQMEGVESKRERKAAKTLAIITGVFVMCWLPFFVMAIAMPLLELKPHKFVFPFFLWLGYFNSMLNPIIYTIFSPDFRVAFKRLLCGQKATQANSDHRRKRPNSSCHSNENATGLGPETSCSGEGCLAVVGHRLGVGLGHATFSRLACCCCWQMSPACDDSRAQSERSNTVNEPISTPHSSPRIIPEHQQQTASVTNLLNSLSKPSRSHVANHF